MKAGRWAFALALALPACGGELGARRSRNPLDASWLEGSPTITAADLERVMALGKNDPEALAVFHDATTRLGGGTVEGLAKHFSVCTADVKMEGGLTLVPGQEVWIGRSLEDLASNKPPPMLAKFTSTGDTRETHVVEFPDLVLVRQTMMPRVCIVGTLSLGEAYEAIVHELVHAARLDPTKMSALAAESADRQRFLMGLALLPGGEVEAYVTGTGARIRLGGMDVREPAALAWFDRRTGQLRAPPEALAEFVLASKPRGLGYSDTLLRTTFETSRQAAIENLLSKQKVEEQLLDERRKNLAIEASNLDILAHNIAAHTHNIEVGRQTNNAAVLERSRTGLAEAQRDVEKTRALGEVARASEARLVEELAVVGRQIDALRAGAAVP